MDIGELLLKELDEAIDIRKEALAKGRVKDYSEYQNIVGVITGLTTTKERLKDLLKYQEEN